MFNYELRCNMLKNRLAFWIPGVFQATVAFSTLLVFLLVSSVVNVAFAQQPTITSAVPESGVFIDPGDSTITIVFSRSMNTASVEDSMFLRTGLFPEEYVYDPPVNPIIQETQASLTIYKAWFPGEFTTAWSNFDKTLGIAFNGGQASPTGNVLKPGGTYTLGITDNQAFGDGGTLVITPGQNDTTYYVPGYGNVNLSSQESMDPKTYVTTGDAQVLFYHVVSEPGFSIFTNFANHDLTTTLANKVADVNCTEDLTAGDAQTIFLFATGSVDQLPTGTCSAPSLQVAQSDVGVSIGTLSTAGDCSSVQHPIVIYPPKIGDAFQTVEVPINICDLGDSNIDAFTFHIQFNPSVVTVASSRLSDEVPTGWLFDGNVVGNEFHVGGMAQDAGPITAADLANGVLFYVTFQAVTDDVQATSEATLSLVVLEDIVPPGTSTYLPTTIVNNDIALPVTLSAFGAVWHPEGIKVFWEAENQQENLGWNIYRSETKEGRYVKINGELIQGAGTTATPMKYHFLDRDVDGGRSYFYYLENVSFGGERYRSNLIKATIVNKLTSWAAIKNASLRQIPLPTSKGEATVIFKSYDLKGKLIQKHK